MKQTQDELASRIASLLDQGARELEPHTAERLAAARKQALARYEPHPEQGWNWAMATGTGAQYGSESRRYRMRSVLLAAAVVSAVAVVATWHSSSRKGPEIADIDAALLTDELPIKAFLDQSFDSWLKRGSR